MPSQHAKVTASGAHRWLNCPASIERERHFPNISNPAAIEGTKAHELAERKLKAWLKSGKREALECEDKVMQEATDGYRDYIIELVNELNDSLLEVEVRLDLSSWIPEGFGTSDACIISTDTLHIVDLKYGQGVRVDAPNNPQMRLYALGAIELYWPIYEFSRVKMHIYQPRLDHISTEEMNVEELRAWGESIKPIAKKAFEGTDEAKSGDWCTFCRCRFTCRTRATEMFEVLEDQPKPSFLSLNEVAAYLPKLDSAIKWAKDLQSYALERAVAGESIQGYRLGEGRSIRKITDEKALGAALQEAGYSQDQIWKPQEIQTITNLEKLVGKKAFAENYGEYLEKPKGKPVLIPTASTPEEMFKEQ